MVPTHEKVPKFHCNICNYVTSRNSQYTRHLLTDKHKILQNPISKKFQMKKYECHCGKSYKHLSSLYAHKKNCKYNEDISNEEISNELDLTDKEIINALIKQNEKLMKLVENGTCKLVNNTSNVINNLDNKTFNLNVFLNETCKDAMNITDFVSSIKLNIEDLEHTGRTGYIEGITSIFLKNLNNLEKHMRPLHCSDFKREILYIKDNNKWEKEIDQKPILTKAIKNIANQNIKQIQNWKEKYPDCTYADSKKNNLYLKIVSNSMSGGTKEECNKNYNKIITNIAKETIIHKDR